MKTRAIEKSRFSVKKISKKERTAEKIKKNVNLFHILTQQKYKEPNTIKEENHIKVDFDEYAFGYPINEEKVEEVRLILEAIDYFSKNPNIEGIEWKEICNEVATKLSIETYLIENKNKSYLFQQGEGFTEITESEAKLLNCIETLLNKIKKGESNHGLVGIVNDEIELVKMFLETMEGNSKNFPPLNLFNVRENIKNKYCAVLVMKTLEMGLKNIEIDELNYFLEKEYQENSRTKINERRITDKKEWAEFIQKKRVRLRKADKFILHSSCQFCFSNYSEQANPFINCPECHIRGHKLCILGNNSVRCGRCTYLRLQNHVKTSVGECFICNVKGLASLRVSNNKYAHIFCILLHNIWKIENEKILIDAEKEIEVIDKFKQNPVICKFCEKETIFYTKCQMCEKACHYSCAYLNGASFKKVENSGFHITCCCPSTKEIEKQSEQRKYILNYENIVFKKLAEYKNQSKNNRANKECIVHSLNCEESYSSVSIENNDEFN